MGVKGANGVLVLAGVRGNRWWVVGAIFPSLRVEKSRAAVNVGPPPTLIMLRQRISRILFSLGCPREGDHFSGTCVAARLKRPTRGVVVAKARTPRAWARSAYLVLLTVGFALPPESPPARCALTAPFHPYREQLSVVSYQYKAKTLAANDRQLLPAVFFLLHFPSDYSALQLASTVPGAALVEPAPAPQFGLSSSFVALASSKGRDRLSGRSMNHYTR